MNQPTQIGNPHQSPLDRLANAVAAGGGAGLAPFAPGTLGAVEGVIVYIATWCLATRLPLTQYEHALLLGALNILVFAVGVWAASRACAISGLRDPQKVVIDEVSGQLIALTPLALAPSVIGVIVGFALFRLFDIFKPYPIRKLEDLPGGFGVMSDDALAGLYAGALVWAAILVRLI